MNEPLDANNPFYGLGPLPADLKSRFGGSNVTTDDEMFPLENDYTLDFDDFSNLDFSSYHHHDDICSLRRPENSNSSLQNRGAAPPPMSSCTKARAFSVPFPPYSYGADSHFFPANGHIPFEQMMSWSSQDPKQEPDDGFRFFPVYGAGCAATGCPGTYCPSSCTLPQCPGANQECSTEDQCSQISCLDSDHCDPACDNEDCADVGSPCNNPHCMEPTDQTTTPFGAGWDPHQPWCDDLDYLQLPEQTFPHAQQCNHTNTEHSVALTLGHLRDPGPQDHAQDPNLIQFGCPILGQSSSPEKLCGVAQPITLPPPLCPDLANDSPSTLTEGTSPKSGTQNLAKHCCKWLTGEAECNRLFDTSDALQDHVQEVHVNILSSKDKYMCRWHQCNRDRDRGFASKNKLRRHITTHTLHKPFKCDQCGEGFSARQALEQHVRTHTGDKPYTCDVPGCGKSFKQKSALTMHKRTHTGEKPLKCEICGKSFGESSNLSKHRKIHSPGSKMKCPEPDCDKDFVRHDQLRRHLDTHEKKKDLRQKKTMVRSKSITNEGDAMKAATMALGQYQFPLPMNGLPMR